MINFIAGGMMGDFIHSLYVVKNICQQRNDKANLYIANGYGDVWRYDLQRTHNDLNELITSQSYINKFEPLPLNFKEEFINLTEWRTTLIHTIAGYDRCWTDVLSQCYRFPITKPYSWLAPIGTDQVTSGKSVIHRSTHRHNGEFPWPRILNGLQGEIVFVTSIQEEWDRFQFKNNRMKLHLVSTVSDMARAIGSARTFVGNQSSPFSIACALDIPRLVELDADPAKFYMDENKYSHNISWFLNHNSKYCHNDSIFKSL